MTALKGKWINGVTLTFRSISSGNIKSDYMAHELKILQLTSATTSTELPFLKMEAVCSTESSASAYKAHCVKTHTGCGQLWNICITCVFTIDALHFCRKWIL